MSNQEDRKRAITRVHGYTVEKIVPKVEPKKLGYRLRTTRYKPEARLTFPTKK